MTEIGKVEKEYIDCGGTMRTSSKINFQLWYSSDTDHQLFAEKLKSIIELSEQKLKLNDVEIEVEYQSETIGRYALDFKDGVFQLLSTMTDCLAPDKCGVPQVKPRIRISSQGCVPNSGCC